MQSMSKLMYKKETIIPHNGKLYKFVEILEEMKTSDSNELIDLTNEEETVIDLTSETTDFDNNNRETTPQYQTSTPSASPDYQPPFSPYGQSCESPSQIFSPSESPEYQPQTSPYQCPESPSKNSIYNSD